MKYLIIGLGSMGKRRVNCLQLLDEKNIIGFDISEERRKETEEKYKIKTYSTIDIAMKQNPDVFIISTPPHLHYEYAKLAIDRNIPFFMELNLISNGLKEIVKSGEEKNILMAASCNMKYVESIKKIKEFIDLGRIGKVTSFTYHVGQYLPDWHPLEDYRKFFGARKETNACIEVIPNELKWLQWIFGNITSISAKKGKYSDLEIDAPDTYQIIMSFDKKLLGHYLVEVVSRFPYRSIKIIGTEGTITWDYGEKTVKLYSSKDKKWSKFPETEETFTGDFMHNLGPYLKEMEEFISALKNEKDCSYPLSNEIKVLEILDAINESTETGKEIEIHY